MPSVPIVKRRPRQNYSNELKAQLVATCQQPGVSMAAIAMANQLNANLLRRWVREHEEGQAKATVDIPAVVSQAPALVPVALQAPALVADDAPAPADLRVEIRHHHTVVQVTWPLSQASACAQWLREILQ